MFSILWNLKLILVVTIFSQEKDDLCNRLVILERDYDDLRNSFEKELELRVSQTLAVARDEQELESDRIRDELDQLYGSKVGELTYRIRIHTIMCYLVYILGRSASTSSCVILMRL